MTTREHLTLYVFEDEEQEAPQAQKMPERISLYDAEAGDTGVLLMEMLWGMRTETGRKRSYSSDHYLEIDRRGGLWIDQRVQLMQDPSKGERGIAARVAHGAVVVSMSREDLIGPGDIRGFKTPAQLAQDGRIRIRFTN